MILSAKRKETHLLSPGRIDLISIFRSYQTELSLSAG